MHLIATRKLENHFSGIKRLVVCLSDAVFRFFEMNILAALVVIAALFRSLTIQAREGEKSSGLHGLSIHTFQRGEQLKQKVFFFSKRGFW